MATNRRSAHPPIRLIAATLLSALAIACVDLNGPDRFTVTLSATTGPAAMLATVDTVRLLRCAVDVRAQAQGEDDQRAPWVGGTISWFVGADRTTPAITRELDSLDVARAWGGRGDIRGGELQQGTWFFISSFPFVATMVFRYSPRPHWPTRTAQATFSCGASEANGG